MSRKKLTIPRRVWRMTAESPLGQVVDSAPTVSSAEAVPPKVLAPPPVVDWRGSSFDLLNGVEVEDQTNSIPGELFDKLFKR